MRPTEGANSLTPQGVSYRIGLTYKPAVQLRRKSAEGKCAGGKHARASFPPGTLLCDTTEKGEITDLSFE